MKLMIDRATIYGSSTEVTMEHDGECLVWNIALFDKTSSNRTNIGGEFDIFEHINGYWAYLPKQNQDKIFEIYKNIRNVFDSIWDTNELTRQLYKLVTDLYVFHELADVRHWMDFHSNVILPDGLRDIFKESHETPGTRERTYLKDDYRWLVTLSVALRAMIPVWGEFISRTKKETGTVFKEYYAFQLLAQSNIIRSEPMERLRVYVEHSLPTDKSKAAAILGGISSEDFPVWILSLVVVRRLVVGDIRGIDPTTSLVTFIYKYIGQKVKGHDNSFIGNVKDKIIDGQGQEGENNLSKLEGYKVKQEIPAGDIAIITHCLSDPISIALKISPDISVDLLNTFINAVSALETEQIWKQQTILVQWVLKTIIPPRGILHIPKTLSLKAIGITAALLWHKQHYELAGLLTAVEQTNTDELMLGGSDSRARITKDQLEQLDVLYPYSRRPSGKQKIIKRLNPAVDAIESVASLFSEHEWKLTLPPEMVVKITGNPNNRRYSTPSDIKIKLATLVIALASRAF